eukprot:UN34430
MKKSLIESVRRNDVQKLSKIREKYPNFSFKFSNHLLIREAVLADSLKALQFLHEKCKIDLNVEEGFCIRYSSKLGLLNMVKYLLNK